MVCHLCALSLFIFRLSASFWKFVPLLNILSLSYLSSYLCCLSPSNCFSTASLAEELQLFKIQLPVQLLNSSGILIERSASQFSASVQLFSTGQCVLYVCQVVKVIGIMYSICLPPVCLLIVYAACLSLCPLHSMQKHKDLVIVSYPPGQCPIRVQTFPTICHWRSSKDNVNKGQRSPGDNTF